MLKFPLHPYTAFWFGRYYVPYIRVDFAKHFLKSGFSQFIEAFFLLSIAIVLLAFSLSDAPKDKQYSATPSSIGILSTASSINV
jgi:hypothetical protein